MDDLTVEFFIEVLAALGQMSHPKGRENPDKIMTMPIKTRSELLSKGWNLLEGNKEEYSRQVRESNEARRQETERVLMKIAEGKKL